ncbi:MAG: FAD-dependent oxidoreductase [Gemmatimonadetes bacterium]|nr:FAD-dependent oxidoreductase [Gemmatimonadota bacterium]
MTKVRDGRQAFPQRPGSRDRAPDGTTALVVGGGLAGIAAACVLAERGVGVTVVEREDSLGGRLRTWSETLPDGSSLRMERGFHAFFRQYYNLRELLRRVDPDLSRLVRLRDYPVMAPGGEIQSFEDLPTRPPWNIVSLVRRAETFRYRDLLKVNGLAALDMLRFDPERTYERHDGATAREYLDSLRFPPAARRMMFDVFSHSFFNPEEEMSAADLLMMFHFYFMANPEGLVFDVLDDEFEASLWTPLRTHLEGLGVRFLLGTEVTSIRRPSDDRWAVELSEAGRPLREDEDADLVVLAVTVPGLQRIAATSPDLGTAEWRRKVEDLSLTLPFAVWRLWLDRPVDSDRQPFVGTAGYAYLDNISVYERFEAESRRWADSVGGSVVELHAYAVPENVGESELRTRLLEGLHDLYPETRDARVLHEVFRVDRDCPAFPPGGHARRPGVELPAEGVALAGDFVRLPFPTALMERATASGFLAANHLLAPWDVRAEPIWSVPLRGPLARRR